MPGFISSNNFVGKYQTGSGMTAPQYNESREVMESYLARINYDYKSKYYASGSVRADGSSKFLAGNRWGVFWSVGGGWRFTAEDFMKPAQSWLDNGKLRVSYGVIGNAMVFLTILMLIENGLLERNIQHSLVEQVFLMAFGL